MSDGLDLRCESFETRDEAEKFDSENQKKSVTVEGDVLNVNN